MTWRPAIAAVLALALAACQATPAGVPRPGSTTAAQSRSASLAAADSRFFAGDYDGAEQAYRAAVDAREPDAGAHLALFLTYVGRFRDGVAVAEAAVKDHEDSFTLARLTRAYDWSGDIDRAIATGQKAISTKPVELLAHVYFAEALADAGRYNEAQAQLKAAENANPSDAYTRAEVDREWANYYRDRGDPAQELNHIQLALKSQPNFPERPLELARHDYAAKQSADAAAVLDKVIAQAKSYWVLVGAGDSALAGHDNDRATATYKAALKVIPDGPEAAVGVAIVAVSGARDFKAAHDVLAAALKKSPGNASVSYFLWYLDKLVLKTDPAQDTAANGAAQAPTGLTDARRQALDAANAYRGSLPKLNEDPAMAEAAEAHAWYTLFNLGDPSLAGLGIHAEQSSLPGYTGQSPLARDVAAGYKGNRGAEILNHVYTPAAAVEVWYDSVYHRYPMTDYEAAVEGYGEAQAGLLAVSVMDIGFGPATTGHAVAVPADGARDVPAAFIGNEIPDPAPQGTDYPVGYPVTYQVGGSSKLAVDSFTITDAAGRAVPSFVLKPGQQVGSGEACVMPQQPLQTGATYTVEIKGTLDGSALDQKWQFTTAGSV